ncbi:tRNA (guanosine(46)-N7)-methyltransferase TrmB [Paracoccaceae bacterium]|nr:tRNA (guanosine(46)-N7)-methyltransferase TrmB [Paracoccaceae bacterium]
MSDLDNYANLRLIKTFGRLKGRSLSQNQKLGLSLLKQKYNFFLEKKKKIWLEVGFGNGNHLVELAKRNYDKLIVGSEVYENGVATACFSLFQNKIQNVRVFHGDARNLFNLFKHKAVDRFYILFPDPWTKKRHKSRRLLSSSNVGYFSKILKSNGYICVATDVEDYFLEIEDTFSNLDEFKRIHVSPKEKNLNFFLNVKTKYEQKAINKGLSPSYLVYKKV